MDMNDFKNSRWMAASRDPHTRQRVVREFPDWLRKVTNSDLIDKARRLWHYLRSEKCSSVDLIIVVAALLYLISPLDAVPDFVPFAGWLDDLTVAGLVLGYLDRKASAYEARSFDV
jgi:uncharacterized membrane protein YkvA (DUF1232 family)